MPLVSVIIATYNSGKFIAQAVQSVLEQSCRLHEVIVIDDGSTDETKDVLSGFHDRIKYFYQENQGPSAARNKGIKMAKGGYISFLDSDDLWPVDLSGCIFGDLPVGAVAVDRFARPAA